jgi:[glutamine synthetase] adenylyltransferase / [glutamine synthetase]-adenylyl-L-tyrosine phosphorylase
LVDAAIKEFETAHGRIDGGELLILALGRLGGEALTHASDLDLVLLFTGDIHSESDGRRPLGATLYFNRLAQRIISALSTRTASGSLYEVDTRLRPSGADGLLCCSVDSFAKYQMDEAWTWEHMALTRARPVYGSPDARLELLQAIQSVLCKSRDKVLLHKDVISMRAEMRAEKKPKGELDIKLLSGGLVDAEFIVHAMQLECHVGLSPQLPKAIDQLYDARKLPKEFGLANEFLTRLLLILRLTAPDCHVPPDPTKILISRLLGFESWSALLEATENARSQISIQWLTLFGTENI